MTTTLPRTLRPLLSEDSSLCWGSLACSYRNRSLAPIAPNHPVEWTATAQTRFPYVALSLWAAAKPLPRDRSPRPRAPAALASTLRRGGAAPGRLSTVRDQRWHW